MAAVPTRGEIFAKLTEHLRMAIECASLMAHLHNTEGNDKDKKLAVGWLMMAEAFKMIIHKVTLLGQGRLK